MMIKKLILIILINNWNIIHHLKLTPQKLHIDFTKLIRAINIFVIVIDDMEV